MRSTFRSMSVARTRWGTCALLVMISLLATSTDAQGPNEDPAAMLARVRELGHALLAEQARERREIDAEIQPTLEALDALRDALRDAAADDWASIAAPVAVGTAAPGVLIPAAALPAPGTEARAQRWRVAREVLARLQAERRALVERRGDGRPPWAAGPADDRAGRVHPDAIETIEDEAAAILATADARGDEGLASQHHLRALLERLAAAAPAPVAVPDRPSAVYRVPAGAHMDAEAP